MCPSFSVDFREIEYPGVFILIELSIIQYIVICNVLGACTPIFFDTSILDIHINYATQFPSFPSVFPIYLYLEKGNCRISHRL